MTCYMSATAPVDAVSTMTSFLAKSDGKASKTRLAWLSWGTRHLHEASALTNELAAPG